jgi:pantoate--beta-alanine ligase
MDSATLPIARTVASLRAHVAAWRQNGETVALVPTMGALHEGHAGLIRMAKAQAERAVASIFVNPKQFGAGEDFDRYPRAEQADAEVLRQAGCDLLYAPTPEAMYPPGFATTVSVAGVSAPLEGVSRPGHFDGVATVVAKLLLQALPDVAIFGEKDFQQLAVIRRLARDLDLACEILAAPTARAPDGLALSSRNVYLSEAERAAAPALHRALTEAAQALADGASIAQAEAQGRRALTLAGFQVDYFEARDPATLAPATGRPLRLLAAARLGATRLIDNLGVE